MRKYRQKFGSSLINKVKLARLTPMTPIENTYMFAA